MKQKHDDCPYKMTIRLETPADYGAVERLTFAAFENFTYADGSRDPEIMEHFLAHIMRKCDAFIPELSFVGELGSADGRSPRIVANIMYTKSNILRPNGSITETITFGPVSVAPELQKHGLGSEIISLSLAKARELGYGAVIILGHPQYYPRFGFARADEKYGLSVKSPDGTVFDGAFMALELREDYLGADGGKWCEDKVFDIDKDAFAAWSKEFHIIDTYIASQPESIQALLKTVHNVIRAAIPAATEKISWQMPTFWQGRNLIHFAAQKNHLGIYPGVEAMEHFAAVLTAYKTSKGAVQFPYKSFGAEQLGLITEIAMWCGRNNAK